MTFDFLSSYGAARFGINTGNVLLDVERWLNSSHLHADGSYRRPSDTWMIISRERVLTRQRFAIIPDALPGLCVVDMPETKAIYRHLQHWDGSPFCILSLEKKRLYLKDIFLTHDLRAVRVCSPRAVECFDFTQPPSEGGGKYHRRLWKEQEACKNT